MTEKELDEKSVRDNLVLKTALTAGRIMMENGSEVARVEDTMKRIAKNAGIEHSKIFIMVTGILMSIQDGAGAQIEPVTKRTFDLQKIVVVNDLSRQYAHHDITLDEFARQLNELDKNSLYFPFWLQLLAAAFVSGPLEVVFRHNYNLCDFLITCLVGAIGWAIFYYLSKLVRVRFVSEFIASVVIAVLAMVSVHFGLGINSDDIIIGSVMPLVPGVPITNAMRDVLDGNLVSGPARAVEAGMSAAAIGLGIAMVIQFY
ncbi:threonine/serine exporter family protein [Levilactobacillus bambusae]|uniref:Threonine/serine exporter-like N-terminal domain-containing protein n=1 Tax=Levilactobacillus bambusae TaxID=2024736 RepID=A0A2V1MYF1_9LACO|nr:threonine/serine exporter family protein [Levilactobacillus bambusae]PWF99998.1 hypothetical protein DCM90_03405 [Levilactobacillus bambusae]